MKNTKKLAAMIAALTLSACSIAPMASFAAPTTLTLTAPTGLPADSQIQNVVAYQVFTTQVKIEGENKLTNIIGWGNGVNSEALLTAITADTKFNGAFADATGNDAYAKVADALSDLDEEQLNLFAKYVINNKVGNGLAGTYANGKATFEDIDDGYYAVSCTVTRVKKDEQGNVVVDEDGNAVAVKEEYDSYSLAMLTVVDGQATQIGTNGVAKIGLPTVQKKVKENSADNVENLEAPAHESDKQYNDIADWNIGETGSFKLYGTLPSNYDKYDEYYYCFTDNLGKEFDLIGNYKIQIDGEDVEGITPAVTNNDDGSHTIVIEFEDLKQFTNVTADSVITVEYDAALNKNAVVGTSGQVNKVDLTYSNNPNNGGKGSTGTTPEDENKVYVYAVKINKTFINAAGGDVTAEEITNGTYSEVIFNLEQNGTPLKFTKVTDEDTENYGKWDYILAKEGDADLELTEVDGELVIRIKGLDEGTYVLRETEGPAGYNLAPAQTVEITAETNNTNDWTDYDSDTLDSFSYTIKDENGNIVEDENGNALENVEVDVSEATASLEVQNKKGASLPSTGGIGTTIFYLGGGAMVAVAGVFLITKKRMGKSEN